MPKFYLLDAQGKIINSVEAADIHKAKRKLHPKPNQPVTSKAVLTDTQLAEYEIGSTP